MWSDLLAENTSRAAALRTDCSRRNNVPDTPTSTEQPVSHRDRHHGVAFARVPY